MASRGINKVTLIGNLGADPEMRYTQNNTAIANLSIATSETWKDKQTGEQREQTEWHRIVIYRRLAEIAGEYLRKGSKVYIEGRLQTRKWQGQDGRDNYTTEIICNELQMLDGRGQGDGQSGGQGFGSQTGGNNQQPPQHQQNQGQGQQGGNYNQQQNTQQSQGPQGGNQNQQQSPQHQQNQGAGQPEPGTDNNNSDWDDDIPF